MEEAGNLYFPDFFLQRLFDEDELILEPVQNPLRFVKARGLPNFFEFIGDVFHP